MTSKIFFTLLTLSLFIAITVCFPFTDDSDEEDPGFNVAEFLTNHMEEQNAFEEYLLDKRAGLKKGRKGKNRYFSKLFQNHLLFM